LADYASRYAVAAEPTGLRFPSTYDFDVVERLPGSATTDSGVLDAIASVDHQKVTAA